MTGYGRTKRLQEDNVTDYGRTKWYKRLQDDSATDYGRTTRLQEGIVSDYLRTHQIQKDNLRGDPG